ncbi:MAG: hypothetical protein KBF76_02065 [Verrucomicrobiales bacterium]|jgi:hypothetical protein|nr:hypothetical protein [Verrucomicrobiales bacterium]
MAIKLIANYAKRLGLPGYSSHQFSVSCETELTDLTQVHDEAARLYDLLQDSVDREIQQTGFVPGDDYGDKSASSVHANGQSHGNGNGQKINGHHPDADPVWQCSDRQRELIIGLATELNLDDASLDKRSERLFRRPAHQLNKLGASGLISDLLAEAGTRRQREGRHGGNAGNGNGTNGSGSTHTPRHGNGNGQARPAPHRNGGGA